MGAIPARRPPRRAAIYAIDSGRVIQQSRCHRRCRGLCTLLKGEAARVHMARQISRPILLTPTRQAMLIPPATVMIRWRSTCLTY